MVDTKDSRIESLCTKSLLRSITHTTSRLLTESLRIGFDPQAILELPLIFGEENCLRLYKNEINADIRSYMAGRLGKSQEFGRWLSAPGILARIQDSIMRKADGM